MRLIKNIILISKSVERPCLVYSIRQLSAKPETMSDTGDEFRVLDLKKTSVPRVSRWKGPVGPKLPFRSDSMAVDQDWTNVWPGPRTFHPASVPLPLRQGINKLGAPPNKYGNAELMKIPNFLHLTPPAIEKHCKALKRFCSEWPKQLHDDVECRKHFPLEVIHTDYCHSSPTIRDPLSRIVTIKFPLDRLELDKHSRDKFLRLVGDRYDEETDMVTIVTDKCPLKQQNYEYALYLLTAVYHESWTFEDWEKEKQDADMEFYDWDISESRLNVTKSFDGSEVDPVLLESLQNEYKKAVVSVFDEGENDYNWNKYKEAAEKLLFIE